jgi:TolB-like protein
MLPVTDTIEAGRPPRTAVISDSIIDEIISELKRFSLQSRDRRTSAAMAA